VHPEEGWQDVQFLVRDPTAAILLSFTATASAAGACSLTVMMSAPV
jgi:hypothetical protein